MASFWEITPPAQYLKQVAENPPPPSFAKQGTLPRLPVPQLNATLDKYLKSVEPVLTTEELEKTAKIVADFRAGAGPRLQAQLEELEASLAAKGEKSWLEDLWLQYAYHIWRDPIVVTSNWYSVFRSSIASLSHEVKQVSRAAALTHNMITYRLLVEKQQVPLDKTKAGPLCMDQYTKIYGVTRIPGEKCDSLRNTPFQESRHIVVLRRDQIYSIEVVSESGEIIDDLHLQAQFERIIDETNYRAEQPPVAILTGEERTRWWRAREAIKTFSARNATNLDIIERAMFAVALDDTSPTTHEELARLLFHNYTGRNRWFDKSFTLIFFANSEAGINAEHSPVDAPSLAHGGALFINYLESVQQYVRLHASAGSTPRPKSLPLPQKLEWDVNAEIETAIRTAIDNVAKFIAPYTLHLLEYSNYGFEEIRKVRVSPDAFIQMAIQLAYYKVHGKSCATYESAQTRAFFHGRTENVRTLSTASVEFVKTFEDKNASTEDKIAALTRAVMGHVAYMAESSNGQGIDRHLLVLRLLAGAAGEQPEIFSDPAFSRSMHFQLSTSNLTPAPEFFGGYGPMYNDGYGVCYALRPYGLWFNVTAHSSCPTTNGAHLVAAIRTSLDEIRALVTKTASQL